MCRFKADAVIGVSESRQTVSLLCVRRVGAFGPQNPVIFTAHSRDMKGLYYVPTRGIKPGIGVVVWLWLVTTVITIVTICSIGSVPSSWRITRLLHAGMALLCL